MPNDPYEIDNLANAGSWRDNNPQVAAKRQELADRLQALIDQRLQPLGGYSSHMPFVVNG